MSIYFDAEDIELPKLDYKIVEKVIKSVLRKERKLLGEISYVFCSDTKLLSINQEFLDHDYFTDIITFDYVEGRVISGDIFISLERVVDNAHEYKESVDRELLRVLFHGLLHLLGYKDHTQEEKQVMRRKEEEVINLFNRKQ